ncbi:uncharacterized protein LOC116102112 isoform X2 [Mastomys coucha]|uniref:uncharacterized protein LOC116102112 isoform X2 n=2 Tax=Mastomys coucha TaxID=35658 RepID=UPI001262318B|nr:uncharacterized protein LOC116102112 isoform X2 [Mastomys coucha]
MASDSTDKSGSMHSSPPDLLYSWEEDRKLVLRGWSLVFIVLATLLVFSVLDGRIAYVHGPYTGFIGLWIDCRRHKCANVGQFTVYIHMSKGFIFLALALCLLLLPTMFLSFRPVCRRLNKIDFIFSFLSIGIGLLILLSLTLFVVNCNRLRPRPQVSYQLAFYLCWCSSFLMLWAGTLSFLNQVRMWSYSTPLIERRLSYFRWASRHHSLQLQQQSILDRNLSAHELSAVSSLENYQGTPQQSDTATSQDTDESPRPDAFTSVPVAQFPSSLP